MAYTIIQGSVGVFDPDDWSIMTGWSCDGIYARHDGCNPGTMIALQAFGLQIGRQYVFSYTIDNVNGSIATNLIAGTTAGVSRTAAGKYTETVTVAGNDFLSWYGSGTFRLSMLKFYDLLLGPQSGRTLVFNEYENKWVQEWSWQAEVMVKYVESLFTFQNGQLWLHNSNPVLNNFFGQQLSAEVTFVPNQNYEVNHLWYNMRLDSVGAWYVDNITIEPNDQFPNGMQTRMSLKNVKSIDGKLWMDILRDMNDPNFYQIPDPQLRASVAMFQGRMMQGGFLIVTLKNDDSNPASLMSAETYFIDVKKSL